jgi:hypothetical protein
MERFVERAETREFVEFPNLQKDGYGKGIDASQSDGYRRGPESL